ncbi:uncharacterized protein [Rutidosis leptorrhynchoides]|uniref:uncharacterized protein n=1 Tax=Rutidosis leptorrhynchoides TaxID=125765 RepID=UPI003A99EBEF
MGSYSSTDCYEILKTILPKGISFYPSYMEDKEYYVDGSSADLTNEDANFLVQLCGKVDGLEASDKYSRPMVWIGFYIAAASLICAAAMAADLLHGYRNGKFWFPCKYFSLNAACITVITVAMKLSLDMTTPMPGDIDQAAKLTSLGFMCTIMANSMPSLASMSSKSLYVNVIGLVVFVITIIVNVCIQIMTGVIDSHHLGDDDLIYPPYLNFIKYLLIIKVAHIHMVYIYLTMMVCLLILMISSAITIPAVKKNLEFKYQAIKKTTLNDQQPQQNSLDQLRLYVTRHWIMIQTSNPQFVIASNPLILASDAIASVNMPLILGICYNIIIGSSNNSSDYKDSTLAIFLIQTYGIMVGNVAPMIRYTSFTRFFRSSRNVLMEFKVEKYWTQKLHEWKVHQILFLSGSPRSKKIVRNLKNVFLSICIKFQELIVVTCKMIRMILEVTEVFSWYTSYPMRSLKKTLHITPIDSTSEYMNEGLREYVLQFEDEESVKERAVKYFSDSMNRLIRNAVKEQHDHNLLKLLENNSNDLFSVENFDTDQVQPLHSAEIPNNWSLPIVTLTCIAISLPNIRSDNLFKSVGEGLYYTRFVEESLNSASEYVNIHNAATSLWQDVEDHCKWLENSLKRNAYNGIRTPVQILKWFADKAKDIVTESTGSINTEQVANFSYKLIAANSMYRIAQTILLKHERNIHPIREEDERNIHPIRKEDERNIHPIREEELFELIKVMIADILVACLTNIPRVIRMKCDESVIEKRVASVEVAVELLGRYTEIINRHEARELPNMNPDKMAFIDEWRLHTRQPVSGSLH